MPELILSSDTAEPVKKANSILEIIVHAVRDPQVDPAKLAALFELKERIDAKNAEMAFNEALARLQPKLPRVKENGTIDLGKGKPIQFATWEDIDTALRPLLAAEGFTLSFTSEPIPAGVLMTCHLKHIQGHAQKSVMQLPPDAGPGRNALQAIGSARSYGKRYLACDILNIVTEGQDNDASLAEPLNEQEFGNVQAMIDACELSATRLKKLLEYAKAPNVESIQRHRYDDVMTQLRIAHKKKQEEA